MDVLDEQFLQVMFYALGYVVGLLWPRRTWRGSLEGRQGGQRGEANDS